MADIECSCGDTAEAEIVAVRMVRQGVESDGAVWGPDWRKALMTTPSPVLDNGNMSNFFNPIQLMFCARMAMGFEKEAI